MTYEGGSAPQWSSPTVFTINDNSSHSIEGELAELWTLDNAVSEEDRTALFHCLSRAYFQ